MFKTITITVALFATMGCARATTPAPVNDSGAVKTVKAEAKKAEAKKSGFSANYRDVSGNVFKFETREGKVHFEYVPMTPERSGSGQYSGGAPNKGVLTAEQLQQLRGHLDALQKNVAVHSKRGRKGTGLIQFNEGERYESFAVQMSALDALNAFLALLRGGE